MRKWLKAGVLEDGPWRQQVDGTPPGGSASPLLANLSLHEVFDRWAAPWRRRYARGEGIIVRSCDEFIVGFQHHDDAEQCRRNLRERCPRCHRERPPDKTRLIAVGRWAHERRQRRGQGKPAPVNCRGCTHIWSQTRTGTFTGRRKTIAKRLRKKLQEIK